MKTKLQDLDIKTLQTPMGKIAIGIKETKIYRVKMAKNDPSLSEFQESIMDQMDPIAVEIHEYFYQNRKNFTLPLYPEGTDLQQKIWKKMAEIPYGHVMTYKELGLVLGIHQRVIGMACRTNPIPILIPCHRILSADPKKQYYSFLEGTDTKNWLLTHEKKTSEAATNQLLFQ